MENLSYKLIPIFNPILPSQFPIPPKISNFNFLAIPYNKSLNPLNSKIKKTLLKNGPPLRLSPFGESRPKIPSPCNVSLCLAWNEKEPNVGGRNVGIPVRTPFLMNIETRT